MKTAKLAIILHSSRGGNINTITQSLFRSLDSTITASGATSELSGNVNVIRLRMKKRFNDNSEEYKLWLNEQIALGIQKLDNGQGVPIEGIRADLTPLRVRFWLVHPRYFLIYRGENPVEIVRVLAANIWISHVNLQENKDTKHTLRAVGLLLPPPTYN